MAGGLIAPGHIFTCSIEDLTPRDLQPFTQFHAFAGVGVWSYALRLAGWPDDRPIWTGSCPCQPFSQSGKGAGFADERHLWPAFFHLVTAGRPERLLGEQVAGRDGLSWIDLVSTDLEGADYAVRAVPLCSAGFGSSDIRNRLYWVADANDAQRRAEGAAGNHGDRQDAGRPQGASDAPERGGALRLAHTASTGSFSGVCAGVHSGQESPGAWDGQPKRPSPDGGPGPLNGFWRNADWLRCTDGRWRPVEPGTFPLDYGSPARVGRLRAAGNAINAQVAAHFIRALMNEDTA